MNIYYDQDADPQFLAGKRIAIIGYGSQGFAHSNNLKDSGFDVGVGTFAVGVGWTTNVAVGWTGCGLLWAAARDA